MAAVRLHVPHSFRYPLKFLHMVHKNHRYCMIQTRLNIKKKKLHFMGNKTEIYLLVLEKAVIIVSF